MPRFPYNSCTGQRSANLHPSRAAATNVALTWSSLCLQMSSWWRHQMKTFSALLVICAANSPVTGEFPAQRPVTRSFDVFFDLRPNKRLSKQSLGWWFETPSLPLWRHSSVAPNGARPSAGADFDIYSCKIPFYVLFISTWWRQDDAIPRLIPELFVDNKHITRVTHISWERQCKPFVWFSGYNVGCSDRSAFTENNQIWTLYGRCAQ